MARDGQIRLPDGSAPASYTVPNAAEIVPKAINATFDGTGAAGSFVPAVEYVSDGGVVVARVPCQTTVSAGGSAEVTFAPFLRSGAGSGGGGAVGEWASIRVLFTAPLPQVPPFPNADYAHETFGTGDVYWETSDATLYTPPNPSHAAGSTGIVISPTVPMVTIMDAVIGVQLAGGGDFSAVDTDGLEMTCAVVYDALTSAADPFASPPIVHAALVAQAHSTHISWDESVVVPQVQTSADLGLHSIFGSIPSAGDNAFGATVWNVKRTNPTIELLYAYVRVVSYPIDLWASQVIVT
jgi:hypothetical protein